MYHYSKKYLLCSNSELYNVWLFNAIANASIFDDVNIFIMDEITMRWRTFIIKLIIYKLLKDTDFYQWLQLKKWQKKTILLKKINVLKFCRYLKKKFQQDSNLEPAGSKLNPLRHIDRQQNFINVEAKVCRGSLRAFKIRK